MDKPTTFTEALAYLLERIQSTSGNFKYLTTDLIEYQLATAHADNNFDAVKTYYALPLEERERAPYTEIEESWLAGVAELLKSSLTHWRKNIVPGRAVFYGATHDMVTWETRYVYLYEFEVRKTHGAAIEKLAQQFGGVGETLEAQLLDGGIYHHRIVYSYSYAHQQLAMLFCNQSVIRERPTIIIPTAFPVVEQPDFCVIPAVDMLTNVELKDTVFGTAYVKE